MNEDRNTKLNDGGSGKLGLNSLCLSSPQWIFGSQSRKLRDGNSELVIGKLVVKFRAKNSFL